MTTGNEIIVVAPKDITEAHQLSKTLSMSALMPQALKKKPEDVLAIVLAGAELNLAPMQAVRGLNIINGKISMSADLMSAVVQRRTDVCEYLTLVESSEKIATFQTKRRHSPEPVKMSFTIQDAQRAGLTENATYKRFPAAMLRARCLAAICRTVYADLCYGLYADGELEGSVVEAQATPAEPERTERAESIKDQIRAQVTRAAPKVDIVDAEIVPEAPAEDLKASIASTTGVDQLKALLPRLKAVTDAALRKELGDRYLARGKALTAHLTASPNP